MAVSTGDAEVDAKVEEWLKWDKRPFDHHHDWCVRRCSPSEAESFTIMIGLCVTDYINFLHTNHDGKGTLPHWDHISLHTNHDGNEKTHAEIASLAKKGDVEDLRTRLCSRLEFGTAGLRGRMGAGYSRMSDMTIIQSTQGLLRHAQNVCPDLKKRGLVVGYDARHNSHRWALMTAVIFLNADVPVYLYSEICPTPFVPYGVLHYGCDVGVMITASHNPKEDNGYKVYWSNGAQIIPPHDSGIAECILQNLEPWPNSWNISAVESHPLRLDPYNETIKCYFEDIGKQLCKHRDANAESPLKFTYTAMHGVGHFFAQESFKTFGFKPFIPVKEQVEPDPEFPTVKFPNPEEGKSALNLSIKTADEHGSTIILANDPDADRLAVAEKQPSGNWKVFTGNELGALLGWWSLTCHRSSGKAAADDVYMLSSTVSSKILKTLAEREGFCFEETLTGFKWMGNRAHELLKEGKKVLFAFEEAIGFMCGTTVLDKDGVSAMSCMAECATFLHAQGLTLTQQLNLLYNKYGIHKSSNSYFLCYHQPVIERIFERIRNLEGPGKYPSRCGRFEIQHVRDLMTGYDSSADDLKARLPVSSSSQMLTFTFANGCVATIRTSGTEPKIKYYTEYRAPPSLDEVSVEKELKEMVENIVNVFLEPVKNELVPRSE